MTTIYLTSSGEYSSWYVTGAFSTKEKAEAHAAYTGSDNGVEEYVVDGEYNPALVGLRSYQVTMKPNGDVTDCAVYYTDYFKEYVDVSDLWDVSHTPFVYKREHAGHRIYCYCLARDEKHAIKIANEKRIGLILDGKLPACAP
jgi:hypothetical protein